jgi:hypothetical protein
MWLQLLQRYHWNRTVLNRDRQQIRAKLEDIMLFAAQIEQLKTEPVLIGSWNESSLLAGPPTFQRPQIISRIAEIIVSRRDSHNYEQRHIKGERVTGSRGAVLTAARKK